MGVGPLKSGRFAIHALKRGGIGRGNEKPNAAFSSAKGEDGNPYDAVMSWGPAPVAFSQKWRSASYTGKWEAPVGRLLRHWAFPVRERGGRGDPFRTPEAEESV